MQLLRTYPYRHGGYPFAPDGEFSVARGYCKAVKRARGLIYLEDQYLWSPKVASCFADALRDNPGLHLVAVVPRHPDRPGRFGSMPQLYGRERALAMLREAGGDRLHVFSPENAEGTPIYVHAKVCVVDDTWVTTGSDNVSLRSWTHDSELTCAVVDPTGNTRGPSANASAGSTWSSTSCPKARSRRSSTPPPRRCRPGTTAAGSAPARPDGSCPTTRRGVPRRTAAWASVVYRTIHDPDGRPRRLRREGAF